MTGPTGPTAPPARSVGGKHQLALGPVQETLLMPMRARAKAGPQFGLLHDPKAIEVCGAIDYDFREFDRAVRTQIGIVLRTLQFDAWVNDFLARHPRGTVVEVGAGLNSRFERTDNGLARYVEIDLPDAMAVRRLFFAESDRRVQVAGNVLDDSWIAPALAASGPHLFVVEGVLMYLSEPQVRGLFTTIARVFPGAHIAFDSLTLRGVDPRHRLRSMRQLDAAFVWGIDEPRQIETWGDGFVAVDSVNLRQVAVRNRHLIPWLMKLIAFGMATVRRGAVNDYRLTLFRLGPAMPDRL